MRIKPALFQYADCLDFAAEFVPGEDDLILAGRNVFNPYFGEMGLRAEVVLCDADDPAAISPALVDAIRSGLRKRHRRIFGMGGSAILHAAKILALRNAGSAEDLFARRLGLVKDKELVLIPGDLGDGCEMTGCATLRSGDERGLLALNADILSPDAVVLIPQLLESLPYRRFAAGAQAVLLRAAEAWMSPRANAFVRLFAEQAMALILRGCRVVVDRGELARVPLSGDFLVAANCAGIASGNAGEGLLRALGRPVAGIGDYGVLTGILRLAGPGGRPRAADGLSGILAGLLACREDEVAPALDTLLEAFLPRTPWREYGVREEDLAALAAGVVAAEGGAGALCGLGAAEILEVYRGLL